MIRLIALILLLIPGVLAAYGIKLLRDSFLVKSLPIHQCHDSVFSRGFIHHHRNWFYWRFYISKRSEEK